MKPHQQRVIDEKNELDLKKAKLNDFYATQTFRDLPEAERSRLLRQGVAMEEYSEVLAERIDAFFLGQHAV